MQPCTLQTIYMYMYYGKWLTPNVCIVSGKSFIVTNSKRHLISTVGAPSVSAGTPSCDDHVMYGYIIICIWSEHRLTEKPLGFT